MLLSRRGAKRAGDRAVARDAARRPGLRVDFSRVERDREPIAAWVRPLDHRAPSGFRDEECRACGEPATSHGGHLRAGLSASGEDLGVRKCWVTGTAYSTRPSRGGETESERADRERARARHDRERAAEERPPPADADVLDRAYRALLEDLLSRPSAGLSPAHRDQLRARGLTDESIALGLYCTRPPWGSVQETLAVRAAFDAVGPRADIPGLEVDHRGRERLNAAAGLLVPVRDVRGRVVGLRIRVDGASKSKYRWPPGSAARCHVARPQWMRPGDSAEGEDAATLPWGEELWVTEGELKADRAAAELGLAVVSLPGVSPPGKAALLELEEAAKAIGAKRAVVAVDADAASNPAVARGRYLTCAALEAAGLEVELASWPADEGKGIDDYLEGCRQRGVEPRMKRERWDPATSEDLDAVAADPKTWLRALAKLAATKQGTKTLDALAWCATHEDHVSCSKCGEPDGVRVLVCERPACASCARSRAALMVQSLAKKWLAAGPREVAVACVAAADDSPTAAVSARKKALKAIKQAGGARYHAIASRGGVLIIAPADDLDALRAAAPATLQDVPTAISRIERAYTARAAHLEELTVRRDRALASDPWLDRHVSVSHGKGSNAALPWVTNKEVRADAVAAAREARGGTDPCKSLCCDADLDFLLVDARSGKKRHRQRGRPHAFRDAVKLAKSNTVLVEELASSG